MLLWEILCVFINSVSFTPLTTKASSCIFTGSKYVKKFIESKKFYTFSVTKCDQIMRNFMQVKLLCYEGKKYKFLMFVLICMNGPCSRIRVYNVVHKLQIPVKNDLLSCEQLT